MEILLEAKGNNGQLELLEDRIRIKRKGFSAILLHGGKGDKDILLKQISSIQFKRAGFTTGYIQFAFLGGTESKKSSWDAYQDENTITFKKSQQPAFEKMKSMIEAQMAKLETTESPGSSLNDLEKLDELKKKGIITEEEFNTKKKQILGL